MLAIDWSHTKGSLPTMAGGESNVILKSTDAVQPPAITKMHIHNAALNRVATMLAKAIFEHCNNTGGE